MTTLVQTVIMVLKVDLGCRRCYKKIKKIICKIPAIKEYAFLDKEDTVMIKVVCCSPENIRQKLICKAGKTIKSIEIRQPDKPKAPAADQKPKPAADKSIEASDKKPKPAADKPQEAADQKPKPTPPADKPKTEEKSKPVPEKTPAPPPVTGYPPLIYPVGVCCKQCFDGLSGGGPCHHGYGHWTPYGWPPSYEGYVRLTPSYDGCRCDRSYGCRCEYYTEEHYPPCTIM